MAKRVRMNKKRWKGEKKLWRRLEREGKEALRHDARTRTKSAAA